MRLDTDIIIDLMNAMGYPQEYLTASQIMDEIASVTPSFAGINFTRLDAGESLQWPCRDRNTIGTPIMHVGKPVRGRAPQKGCRRSNKAGSARSSRRR